MPGVGLGYRDTLPSVEPEKVKIDGNAALPSALTEQQSRLADRAVPQAGGAQQRPLTPRSPQFQNTEKPGLTLQSLRKPGLIHLSLL